jgi:hypothetical protein
MYVQRDDGTYVSGRSIDIDAEYLAHIGDADLYLSRKDASVVCRAIALSLPAFSGQRMRAVIGSWVCRFGRWGDRWVIGGHSLSDRFLDRPITAKALVYLNVHASAGCADEVRQMYKYGYELNRNGLLPVDALDGLLGRGKRADERRAAARARSANAATLKRAAESQRALLGD